MPNRLEDCLENVRKTGTLDEDHRRALQRIVYEDGAVTLAEADTIFAIHDAISIDACPEWPDVFVGAVTDMLVRQSFPVDQIDAAEAVWLMSKISADGVVRTETELALLLNVLKYANSAPDSLEKFALDQVRNDVTKTGFVCAEDVERLRAVLYACGSSGGVAITQMEAETLFDIADATATADNDDSFTDLFVGAVANHIMMSQAPAKVSTEEALRREYWLNERGDIKAGWGRAMRGLFSNFGRNTKAVADDIDLFGKSDSQSQDWLKEDTLRAAEVITASESRWLIDRLNRDGKISPPEVALLSFLAEEAPQIHESLTPLIRANVA